MSMVYTDNAVQNNGHNATYIANKPYNLGRLKHNCGLPSDVHECDLHLDTCQQQCENEEGGYRCTCYDGFRLDNDVCVQGGPIVSIH